MRQPKTGRVGDAASMLSPGVAIDLIEPGDQVIRSIDALISLV